MRASPRCSLAVSLTVCSALVAGCGGTSGPKLPHDEGAELIALAHRIATEDGHGQARDIPRLRERTIALINAGKVPAKLQEPLLSMVNGLDTRPGVKPSDAARSFEAWLRSYSS